jgi:hypothetical protein
LQQKLIFEIAQKQQIPYSVVRLPMYPALGAELIGVQPFDRKQWHMALGSEGEITITQTNLANRIEFKNA